MIEREMSYRRVKEHVKSQLVDEAYLGIMLLAVPIVFALSLTHELKGMVQYTIAIAVMMSFFAIVYHFRKTIPYHYRVNLLITAASLLAIDAFLRWGMLSSGQLIMFIGVFIVSMHYPRRTTILYFLFTVLTYFSIAYIISKGYVDRFIDVNFDTDFYSLTIWHVNITVFILMLLIAVRSVMKMDRFMDNFIFDLNEQYSVLQKKEKEIQSKAYYDHMTGLPNRLLFGKEVKNAIRTCQQNHGSFIMAYLDIDDFKKINNIIGHDTGDRALRSITKKLQLHLPDGAIIARMGGDEFAILATCITCQQDYSMLYSIIRKAFNQTLKAHGAVYRISTSVGFITYPDHGQSYSELLKNADTALYKAKSLGKDQYIVYDSQMKALIEERISMEGNLESAVKNNEIYPHYQPKYDPHTGQIIGFETLARWHSPILGQVSPVKFIPVLEESGMIVASDKQIMNQALHQLKAWHDMGYTQLTMAVNISALQFKHHHFTDEVFGMLNILDLPPSSLEIEITESILINDFDHVVKTLHKLRQGGVSIALDDFGTGYSSLTYLKNLPINTLKIDRSFVQDINKSEVDEILLPTIIDLAHKLNFKVVAEGVENAVHESYLAQHHCDYLQGYFFSMPGSAEDMTQLLIHLEREDMKERLMNGQ